MNGDTVYVYGLKDPVDGCVRYVGQTRCVSSRVHSHVAAARKNVDHPSAKDKWILDLEGKALFPEVVVLEVCRSGVGETVEKKWIDIFMPTGKLFNSPFARTKVTTRKIGWVSTHVAMRPEERALCNAAARKAHISSYSDWARGVLLDAAKQLGCRTDSQST